MPVDLERFDCALSPPPSKAKPKGSRELIGTLRDAMRPFADGTVIAFLEAGEVVKGPIEEGEQLFPGTVYRFLGRWEEHWKHGPQFIFATFVKDEPHSRSGIIAYLTETADGVGVATAEKLWQAYQSNAVTMLRENPGAVVAAGIMNAENAKMASACLDKFFHLEGV
jgi:hypothetical protein